MYISCFFVSLYHKPNGGTDRLNGTHTMITEKQYLESVKIVNEYLLQQVTLKKIPTLLIENVDMKYRLYNILKSNGVTTLNELSTMTPNDFMKFRHFGNKTFQHLEDVMEHHKIPISWK